MAVEITKGVVDALKPGNRDRFTWDSKISGFGVKTTPSGRRVFIFVYRFPRGRAGRTRRFTIGAYPSMHPGVARQRAAQLAGDVAHNIDPMTKLETDRKAAEAERRAPRTSVEAIARRFVEQHHKKHNRTWREAERLINRHIVPEWGRRQIGDITRGEVNEALDRIEAASGAPTAHAVLKQIRRLFNWYAVRDERFSSPLVKGMARVSAKRQARKRTLTDDELRILWRALDASPPPFRQLVRFLLVTAQRRSEVARARWSEFAGDTWTIPEDHYKTDLVHVVPVTTLAREQLDDLGDYGRLGTFVFTTTGDRPFSGFSKAKASLDAEMLRLMRLADRKAKLAPWVLHDLRRTAKTLMQRAGVPHFHSERVLGHVIAGVEGTYDRHEYLAEKREALEKLASEIRRAK